MTETPRENFLRVRGIMSELAELADQLRGAIAAFDYYEVGVKSRDIGALRTDLKAANARLASFTPTSEDEVEVEAMAEMKQFVARIDQGDQLLRRWLLHQNTHQMFGLSWATQALCNLPELTRWPTVARLRRRMAGIPAVIVSAGPSLDRHLERLHELKGKALLIGGNRTAKPLARAGAPADLVVIADAQDLRTHLVMEDGSSHNTLVPRISCHPSVFELPARRIFSCSGTSPHEEWIYRVLGENATLRSGGSVANMALDLAIIMGCDPIIFVGQDLAISGANLHASKALVGNIQSYVSNDKKSLLVVNTAGEGRADRHDLFEVPGYYAGTVTTTRSMIAFLQWFNEYIPRLDGTHTIINATEGGARIEGTIQMPLDEAISKHCSGDVEIEARLDAALSDFRSSDVVKTLRDRCARLIPELDHSLMLADECRNLSARAMRTRKPDVAELRAKEGALSRSMTEIQPLLAVAASGTLQKVLSAARGALDLRTNLSLSHELHTGLADAIRRIRPSAEHALANMPNSAD